MMRLAGIDLTEESLLQLVVRLRRAGVDEQADRLLDALMSMQTEVTLAHPIGSRFSRCLTILRMVSLSSAACCSPSVRVVSPTDSFRPLAPPLDGPIVCAE